MTPLLSPQDFFHPQLSDAAQAFISMAYGVMMAATLVAALPQWRRFFMSERWGGYAQSSPDVDLVQNPYVSPLVAALWLASTALITAGWWSAWAALLNLLLCRHFFVRMRWKGVLRGMGAPGFMSYWLAAVVFLLEFTRAYAPAGRSLVVLVAQVDFAFIMLSAGLYKLSAGYARNHGMELGMVNPEWGYWWRSFARVPPGSILFRVLNHLAWSTEVVAGLLMLFPPTRFVGALLILFSFIFIATQIRLGLLCEMVIVGCLLFFHPGSYGDQLLAWLTPAALAAPANPALAVPPLVGSFLGVALWAYLVVLPFAHGVLFYNFYGRRSLPKLLQRAHERYTNFFGIILWRVFSVDVVNFFILIHREPRAGAGGGDNREGRRLVSRYGLRGGLRYNHVGESITVTSLFTTLKYYPSNDALFRERLLRYARTVPRGAEEVLVFEYVSIGKREDRFDYTTVAEYAVDPAAGTISERLLNESFSVHAAHAASPVHEGARPGSYVPLKG